MKMVDFENLEGLMTVALIDRFPTIRIGLRAVLTSCTGNIRFLEAANAASFSASNKKANPQLIIVGLGQFEEDDELAILLQLGRLYPLAKLIVNDSRPIASLIPQYFHAGVFGYLSTSVSEYELRECISNVLKGRKYIDNGGLNFLLEAVPARIDSHVSARVLTARETEIAHHMIRGVKISEIARILGRELSTVSTIKKKIYKKLNVSNLIELNAVLMGQVHLIS